MIAGSATVAAFRRAASIAAVARARGARAPAARTKLAVDPALEYATFASVDVAEAR